MQAFRAALSLVVVLVLVPAPAQAWFGWLDNLSGPGKFHGWQYEFRLMCFGTEAEPKRLAAAISEADNAIGRLTLADALIGGPTYLQTQSAFDTLDAELERYYLALPVYGSGQLLQMKNDLRTSRSELKDLLRDSSVDSVALGRQGLTEPVSVNPARIGQDKLQKLMSKIAELKSRIPNISQVEPGYRAIESIATTGVFWSLCDTDTHRRSSLDVGVYLWTADGSTKFASSQEIKLNTAMAFYSFRVFRDPRYDFVDAGIGGGIYWFSSLGFDSFHGVIVQPIRGDFHAPTVWASYPWKGQSGANALRRIAAIPTFRLGAMLFPGGFKGGAFGTEAPDRIASDLVPTWTLFFNLRPLLPRRMDNARR